MSLVFFAKLAITAIIWLVFGAALTKGVCAALKTEHVFKNWPWWKKFATISAAPLAAALYLFITLLFGVFPNLPEKLGRLLYRFKHPD